MRTRSGGETVVRLRQSCAASLALASLCVLPTAGEAQGSAVERASVVVEKNLGARMRDGVVLRADVYRPRTAERRPALLQRTPYSKNPEEEWSRYHRLAASGFVVVVQDTRGRYMSDGIAIPHDEGTDGYDTIEWVASLPYVDGRVGMFGGSYSATTQLLAAPLHPPHLVALMPSASYASRYDMVFQGGAFYLADGLGWNLGQAMDTRRRILDPKADRDREVGLSAEQRRALQDDWIWRLPLDAFSELDLRRFSSGYFAMLAHPSFDAFWTTFDVAARHERFTVPAYHLTGWYDALLNGTLRNFSGLRANAGTPEARRNQRLIVGPWTHASPGAATTRIGDVDFGPDAGLDAEALRLRWFRHWMGGSTRGDFPGAPVRIFVMGEDRWRDEQEWPLARARATPLYLQSDGAANTREGDGRLAFAAPPPRMSPDTFTYDPRDPVLTGSAGAYSRAPTDQRATEMRRDVLVYTTEPLREAVEVTGPVQLVLWAASSARDTDFTGRLVDVHPDGTARALTDGILRARYRNGRAAPELLSGPREVARYVIELGATSNLFLPGHRIRLEVSSSNFPRFDRNPNTGAPFGTDPALVAARQTVFHDEVRPSHLVLPIIPRENTQAPASRAPLGYSTRTVAGQRATEQRFRADVSAASISALHLPLTRRPHPASSPGSTELVEHLDETLRSFGLEVEAHDYQAYLSLPGTERLTMTAPARRELSSREPPIASDPTSGHPELREAYVAYGASGTAEGSVVYVNYGLPADYAELERLGVSVRGRIALARYGRSHRAVKVFGAQQAGARALILYSDPADDGAARGPVWPDGYWRGEQMPQRGNAKFSWYYHGDPLTPGVAATAEAARLDPRTAPTLPTIPVMAIGWGEAQHLLRALGGPAAPSAFRGAVPVPYRVGPGPAAVRLEVRHADGLRPIRNVLATLRGSERPERTILLGTHHDAWTFGGVDPGTGMVALLEVARALGEMARTGWRPRRSIAFAFWDAEEYGLIGSTEYAEQWREALRERLVAYVNIDMYMRGRFDPGGVPSLRDVLVDVARDVPQGEGTVLDGWRESAWARLPERARGGAVAEFVPDLKALGSGADFVPFQDHLGVPTLAVEFIGANGYGFGTYHTNFDSRAYVERIADPGFTQGVTMSQVLGTLALRIANAEVLPFRFSHYAGALVEATGAAAEWRSQASSTGATVTPDLAGVRARALLVAERSAALERAIDEALVRGPLREETARSLNDRLARLEQLLADDEGAPENRWYRHVFYGWNIHSLYDGQPFPGLAEGVRLGSPARVQHEVGRIERALERMAAALDAARALVEDHAPR